MADGYTDLVDLVEAFKREVAVPGAFAQDYPLTNDEMITASLGDAFAEAKLEGFFKGNTLDVDEWQVTPALSTAGAALVIAFAGIRLLRQKVLGSTSKTRYQAGPVSAEQGANSYAQTELLKSLERRRDQLIANADAGPTTFVLDGYVARGGLVGGLFAHEMR